MSGHETLTWEVTTYNSSTRRRHQQPRLKAWVRTSAQVHMRAHTRTRTNEVTTMWVRCGYGYGTRGYEGTRPHDRPVRSRVPHWRSSIVVALATLRHVETSWFWNSCFPARHPLYVPLTDWDALTLFSQTKRCCKLLLIDFSSKIISL